MKNQNSKPIRKKPLSSKGLSFFVIGWILITLYNYYYANFFFLGFIILGMIILLLILTLIHLIQLFKENFSASKTRIASFLIYGLLFFLTLQGSIVNRFLEKTDWKILRSKRITIVDQVKNGELKPNVRWNNFICELPFEFPVVSNGGNDIGISKMDGINTTVSFYIFRNFFESPSTYFIYTDDSETIQMIENKINEEPNFNWKIEDNWYRTYGELYE